MPPPEREVEVAGAGAGAYLLKFSSGMSAAPDSLRVARRSLTPLVVAPKGFRGWGCSAYRLGSQSSVFHAQHIVTRRQGTHPVSARIFCTSGRCTGCLSPDRTAVFCSLFPLCGGHILTRQHVPIPLFREHRNARLHSTAGRIPTPPGCDGLCLLVKGWKFDAACVDKTPLVFSSSSMAMPPAVEGWRFCQV